MFSKENSIGTAIASNANRGIKDNYFDQNSLNAVKIMGRHNDPQALQEISKKFEAMFVQQMLKSMRDANEVFEKDNLFSSDEVKFHQDMLDQQMVLNLTSGQGLGLAKVMHQQLLKNMGKTEAELSKPSIDGLLPMATPIKAMDQSAPTGMPKASAPVSSLAPSAAMKPAAIDDRSAPEAPPLIARQSIKSAAVTKQSIASTPDNFIAAIKPFALQAAAELQVNPDILTAQAALETGWGKYVLHDANGNSSFNMFNIKANRAWQGKTIGVKSLEFKDGIAQQEHSNFRSYESFKQSFADYVNLIKNNPRYQQVLQSGKDSAQVANELQKAGYATDPHYAKKLKMMLASEPIRSAFTDLSSVTQG